MLKCLRGNKLTIIAIANQKGGVGKTTTSVNLTTAIAASGYKTLMIDLDPQGNASTGLGFYNSQNKGTVYEVLRGDQTVQSCLYHTAVPGLDILTSTPDLAAIEQEFSQEPRKQYRLQHCLQKICKNYEFIIIDCPPSLGLLTINALTTAQHVIVPLQCEYFALEGMSQLFKSINRVKEILNPTLNMAGIVLTMYDRRNQLCDLVATEVKSFFGDKVFQTFIPRTAKISESPSYGLPVVLHDIRNSGAIAYLEFAHEVLNRLEGFKKNAA